MDIYRLKQLSAEERETILFGESDSSEEMTYQVPMDDEELTITEKELAKQSLAQAYLSEEIKEAKARFKERMDPISDAISEAIAQLKTKQRTITAKVFNIPDHDNRMMHTVDLAGNVLHSRPMKPEERQLRINGGSREAV